jgi:hypothetical protein
MPACIGQIIPSQQGNIIGVLCLKTVLMLEKRQRKTIRLKEYDYSQPGEYFVTICAKNHECMFGSILNGSMNLNEKGRIVDGCWKGIPEHFPNVDLDEYVIMPNHFHGIVIVNEINILRRGEVTSPL